MEGENKEQLQEMSFWDHLDVLRGVLIKIAVVVVALAIVFFALMPTIFDNIILAPCNGDFVLYRLFEKISVGIPGLPQFSTEGFHVELIGFSISFLTSSRPSL